MLPEAFDRRIGQLTERFSGERWQPLRRDERFSAIWALLATYDPRAGEFVITLPTDKASGKVLPQYDFGVPANERLSPAD